MMIIVRGVVVVVGGVVVVWDEDDEHGNGRTAEEDGAREGDVWGVGFGDVGGEFEEADAFVVAETGVRVDGDVVELVGVFVVRMRGM